MQKLIMTCVALCAGLLVGCSATTNDSLRLASDLQDQIREYRDERNDSINQLNAEYRATYAAIVSDYRSLAESKEMLSGAADAREMAETILSDWQSRTTFSSLTEQLGDARDRQLEAIAHEAEVINRARGEYAESYKNLSLELKKLDKAAKELGDLAQPDDERKRTLEVLILLGETINEVRKSSG